jgi:Flp pilus assembly pilin Flp
MSLQGMLWTLWLTLGCVQTASSARLRPVLQRAEQGDAIIEYVLLAALIAIACLGAITALGNGLAGVFQRLLSSISGIG